VIKNKISFSAFFKKIKPAVMTAFATGSSTAALSQCYDISEHQLGIKPLFSSFWQPLSYGMLGPGYTIGYVLAPFMVAQMMGTPVSLSFIVVLFLISLQLSMAMPGLEAALAIIFHCMGMPLEHVGLFAAYNVFIKNFSTACVVMYRMIEQTEVAIATDNIDMSCLNSEKAA
nr:dicarboxylate/amino acid:cation symporter [Bacteroidales bacterium]